MTSATTGKVSSAQDAGNDTAGEGCKKWIRNKAGWRTRQCRRHAVAGSQFCEVHAAEISTPAAPPTEGQDCGMKQEGE